MTRRSRKIAAACTAGRANHVNRIAVMELVPPESVLDPEQLRDCRFESGSLQR